MIKVYKRGAAFSAPVFLCIPGGICYNESESQNREAFGLCRRPARHRYVSRGMFMKVIDAHTHIFPDGIAAKATHAIVQQFPTPEPTHHHGGADELARALDNAGITWALVFSAATSAKQVEHIHRFLVSAAQEHEKFIPCGTLHVDYENYKEELRWLREHDIHGIKIHPEMQQFALDDPRLLPMYEEMEKNDMFLIAHMGDPRVDLSGPKHMIPLAEQFPRLRMIACHLGSWGDWRPETITELVKYPNVYTDISSSFSYVTGSHKPLYEMLKAYDPTHIFFGSDYPVWCPVLELEKARALALPEHLREDILYHNFAEFYHYKQL